MKQRHGDDQATAMLDAIIEDWIAERWNRQAQ
jgi:hypothetical protein